MAGNYVQDRPVKNWLNNTGANVVTGQFVRIGNCIAVALGDIANNASGSVDFTPGTVWREAPKVSAAVFVVGEKLLWDASANGGIGAFDDSAASGTTGDLMGGAVAWEAGANAETTCVVMLTPGNTTLT